MMSMMQSNDPRAVRTRKAFWEAFKQLLQEKTYPKITVTDIAKKAGYARHTFYNHFTTKEELLIDLINSVLDIFFTNLVNWNLSLSTPEEELQLFTAFFQVWKDNPDIVQILNKIDYDSLLIEQLKDNLTRFYHERVSLEISGVNLVLANYVINFNAYGLLGILKPWLHSGMRHAPEDMAGFLIQLTGSSHRQQAVEQFKHILK